MRKLQIVTGGLWAAALVLLVIGWISGSDDVERLALLLGMAGSGMLVATSIRWGTTVLVHVLALYNDDLPTPEGAALLVKLVPEPKHAGTPDDAAKHDVA